MSKESESVLKPGEQIKPVVSQDDGRRLVELRYGFTVREMSELDAYDDCNYRVLCEDRAQVVNPHVAAIAKDGYVLKIVNSLDSRKTGLVEAQNELLLFLGRKGFVCPAPVRQRDGSYYSVETLGRDGQRHVLRLLVYRPGKILNEVPLSAGLLTKVGLFAARLDQALADFSHPGYDNVTSLWHLSSVPKLRDFLFALDDRAEIDVVGQIVAAFEDRVLGILGCLEAGMIHGDLNENNIVARPDGRDIEAIIDFGDSHRSCYVFELAICLCYMITEARGLEQARHVIEGYREIREPTRQERRILRLCVCARLAQSLVLGSYSHKREPENEYLVRAHPVKWELLKRLWPMDDDEVMAMWGIQD